jgi:hypothetical protein
MPEKVSAATISALTAASGFPGPVQDTPPAAEQMIEQIRADLKLRIEALAKLAGQSKAAETDPAAPPSPFEISYQRTLQDQKDFEKIIANVPKGFRLTPVLYSKVEREQNAEVYTEYSRHVRRNFLKYIAEHHANELAALGICQTGIDRMKKGLDPADANGVLYKVNIDHIVERSGGGQMSLQKAADPLLQPGSEPTYLVNHMSNLILLPEQVHEAKNTLNDAQQASKTKYGESRWVLMLIPETGPAQSGFVAMPQDQNHYLHGIEKRQLNAADRISHAAFITDQLQEALEAFRRNPGVENILKSAQSVAERQRKTVVGLVQEEETSGILPAKHRLSSIFNRAMAGDETLEMSLKPVINEAAKQLRDAFNEASRPGPDRKDYDDFIGFYQSKKIKALRQNIEKLPLKEAVQLQETLVSIDLQIQINALHQAIEKLSLKEAENLQKALPAIERKIQLHLKKLHALENKKPENGRHKPKKKHKPK